METMIKFDFFILFETTLQINNSASVQPVDQMLTDRWRSFTCFPKTQLFSCSTVSVPASNYSAATKTPSGARMQTVRNRRICPVAQIGGQFVCSLN